MHYSFWLFEEKKKTYSVHFIIQYSHESILVLFLSSYWLIHMLFRCQVHRCHILLCVCSKRDMGELLLWFVWDYSTVTMWERVYSKKCQNICPQFGQYRVFICSSSISSVLESQFQKAIVVWSRLVTGRGRGGGRSRRLALKFSQCPPLWSPRIRNISLIRNDAVILGGEKVINSHEFKCRPGGL